jgi:hypothetical protein
MDKEVKEVYLDYVGNGMYAGFSQLVGGIVLLEKDDPVFLVVHFTAMGYNVYISDCIRVFCEHNM